MVKKKVGKERRDRSYWNAKEEGYRARSAYKIIQIDKKCDIFKNANSCIDLCAAPGSWLQVAQGKLPKKSIIVGVDLVPIKPLFGVKTIVGDITHAKTLKLLQGLLSDRTNLVLCDGAPNVSGTWSKDAYSQNELALKAAEVATKLLKPKGSFVVKIFRSGGFIALMKVLRQLFHKVICVKPTASRQCSAEIFAVCQNLVDAKINPNLFDSKIVFNTEDVKEPVKTESTKGHMEVLRDYFRNKPRRAIGYDSDKVYQEIEASEYIKSNRPADILVAHSRITFNSAESQEIKNLSITSEELLNLAYDLKVLNFSDLRQLLQWQRKVVKLLFKPKNDETTEKSNEDEDKELLCTDDEIDQELVEHQHSLSRIEKKKIARQHKQKLKHAARISQSKKNHMDEEEPLFRCPKQFDNSNDVIEQDNLTNDSDQEGSIHAELERKSRIPVIHDVSTGNIVTFDTKETIIEEKDINSIRSASQDLKMVAAESELHSKKTVFDILDQDLPNMNTGEHQNKNNNMVMNDTTAVGKTAVQEKVSNEDLSLQHKKATAPGIEDKDGKGLPKKSLKRSTVSENDQAIKDDATNKILRYKATAAMIAEKETRDDFIDKHFNKYVSEIEDLPDWFVKDQEVYNQPHSTPKDELTERYEENLRDLGGYKTKKECEIAMRKKRRVSRRLDDAWQRSSRLDGVGDEIKQKSYAKMKRKVLAREKINKVYVTPGGKKTGQVKKGAGRTRTRFVDKRLKKDKRGEKRQRRKKGGKNKSGKRTKR